MAFKLPWSNFHELNLDWVLEKMKELEEKVNAFIGSAVPSNDPPEMDGTASAGSSVNYARGDHVHPTDTSRASASDLSALDTTVYNNYVELHGDINTVDAKIAFDSAAPAMDGVASPGSSAYQARADHVHPTDTSRASKSEFDTLKATVDAWAGAASPYDGVPNMDGVGDSGSLGAYSRGDHTHPSDSSKLDKSGGTITGILLVASEHVFRQTSAIGWLRVGYVPQEDGIKAVFTITRKGDTTPSETHSITLTINHNAGIVFSEEDSISDVCYINKIRYTDAGAIDIHVDQAYDFDIGVHLDKYATRETAQNQASLSSPQFVADAPDGETVLSSYDFVAKTYELTSATKFGKQFYIQRYGKICTLMAPDDLTQNIPANTNSSITNVPKGCIPNKTVIFPITNNPGGTDDTYVMINQYGTVILVSQAGQASGTKCGITGTWIGK